MRTLNEAFALRVRELLKEKKLTQYKIETSAAIYHSTMNSLMNGKYKASNSKTMALIIRELGVTMEEFFASPLFDFNELDID